MAAVLTFGGKFPPINSQRELATNCSIIALRSTILPDYGSEDAF